MIPKHGAFFFWLVIIAITTGVFGWNDIASAASPTPDKIEIGMSQKDVRKAIGMPRNMSRTAWKYPKFVVYFEKQKVACVVKASCFQKWPSCSAFKKRAPDCIIK